MYNRTIGSWSECAPLSPLRRVSGCAVDNVDTQLLFVFGGIDEEMGGCCGSIELDLIEMYNPRGVDEWVSLSPPARLKQGKDGLSCASMFDGFRNGHFIFCVGGSYNFEIAVATVEVFNPRTLSVESDWYQLNMELKRMAQTYK